MLDINFNDVNELHGYITYYEALPNNVRLELHAKGLLHNIIDKWLRLEKPRDIKCYIDDFRYKQFTALKPVHNFLLFGPDSEYGPSKEEYGFGRPIYSMNEYGIRNYEPHKGMIGTLNDYAYWFNNYCDRTHMNKKDRVILLMRLLEIWFPYIMNAQKFIDTTVNKMPTSIDPIMNLYNKYLDDVNNRDTYKKNLIDLLHKRDDYQESKYDLGTFLDEYEIHYRDIPYLGRTNLNIYKDKDPAVTIGASENWHPAQKLIIDKNLSKVLESTMTTSIPDYMKASILNEYADSLSTIYSENEEKVIIEHEGDKYLLYTDGNTLYGVDLDNDHSIYEFVDLDFKSDYKLSVKNKDSDISVIISGNK